MVPRIRLHLGAPGVSQLFLAQWGLLLLTVGALTLTGTFWWIGSNLHQQIDALDAQVLALSDANDRFISQAQSDSIDLSAASIAAIPQQITFVKHLRERVGFSWTKLLTDLETALPPRISMNVISMEEKTNTIQLQGSASTLEDLNALIHKLEDHTAFHDVRLGQHATKSPKKNRDDQFVVFSMKVSYRPQF